METIDVIWLKVKNEKKIIHLFLVFSSCIFILISNYRVLCFRFGSISKHFTVSQIGFYALKVNRKIENSTNFDFVVQKAHLETFW